MTMQCLNLFYFILILWCLDGTEVVARKGKCADSCDESMDDDYEDEMNSYEDSSSQCDDSDADTDHLLSRIKKLEKELRRMFRTEDDLMDALIDCLRLSKREESKLRKSKIRDSDLCYLTSDGCDSDYHDDDSPAERDNYESTRRLKDKIHDLERSKDTMEMEIGRLQTRLDECKRDSFTTPKPKIKKYIIRTTQVSWNEAVRLCTNEQKQIATITSKSEQDALGQARKDQGVPSGQLWIGGRRNSPADQFSWRGQNPTAFTYTNWHSTEPSHWSDDDQNCVESSWESNHYMWFVYECDTKYNYACEYY